MLDYGPSYFSSTDQFLSSGDQAKRRRLVISSIAGRSRKLRRTKVLIENVLVLGVNNLFFKKRCALCLQSVHSAISTATRPTNSPTSSSEDRTFNHSWNWLKGHSGGNGPILKVSISLAAYSAAISVVRNKCGMMWFYFSFCYAL